MRAEEAKRQKKELEDKEKKVKRWSQCSGVVSLWAGALISQVTAKRDGTVHPYEYTSDYFDEDFLMSADILADFPDEIDVNSILEDVDIQSYLNNWLETIQDRKRALYNNCNFVGKRSLDRRCSQRRSLEDYYGEDDLDIGSANTSSLVERQTESPDHLTVFPRGSHELDKRFWGALFSSLAQWGSRLGMSLASLTRSASSAVAAVTKVAKQERLFQIAAGTAGRGRTASGGTQAMQKARDFLKNFRVGNKKEFQECLKKGVADAL